MERGDKYKESLKDKSVLVIGMGKSGKAAVRALKEAGAKISIQDSKKEEDLSDDLKQLAQDKNITPYFDKVPEDMSEFDMLVMSPGVPTGLEFVKKAAEAGAEIIGELELAYRLGMAKFVGITGTNGKTTTTTLVGEIFKNSGRRSAVVGNIGNPVVSEAMGSSDDDWLVTEISSFQLETTHDFRPVVSAILNLTPDHLNRHGSFEAYGEAKAKIAANQSEDDYLVINADDDKALALAENTRARLMPFSRRSKPEPGAYIDDNQIIVSDYEGQRHDICGTDDLRIIGDHNIENALAAAAICICAGISDDVISDTIKEFPGVEHRVEFCGHVDGVDYYNDSKGTNVSAATIAMDALRDNIVLIAGGDAKGQDFSEFAAYLAGRVDSLILLGRDAGLIEDSARQHGFENIYRCKDMEECVRKAAELAKPGSRVLLSPACASWDMYDNFEQRGDHFKQCVRDLQR